MYLQNAMYEWMAVKVKWMYFNSEKIVLVGFFYVWVIADICTVWIEQIYTYDF